VAGAIYGKKRQEGGKDVAMAPSAEVGGWVETSGAGGALPWQKAVQGLYQEVVSHRFEKEFSDSDFREHA